MVNIIFEIMKKELKSRFGSKTVIIPLLISVGIPFFVFIPNLQNSVANTEPDTEFMNLLFFLVIPIMITTLVGINSFINEIRWKSIKILLVAPITEREIFIGKSLACIFVGLAVDFGLSLFLLLTVEIHSTTTLIIFFILGPLSIIFTTFLFIMGTSRFPWIVENGGVILLPMFGLTLIFLMVVYFRLFLMLNLTLVYLIISLLIALLSGVTILYARKWFNREILVLSI